MRGNLLHVDLDGITAQEVFDLDLLDGALLEGPRPIVGHLRRHEDLDALLQESVRQVGVLQHLRLGRRDNHRRHIVPVHQVQEVLVVAVDIDTHHHLSDHVRVIGDKAHHPEAVVLLRTEGLGNVDAGHRPVDVRIHPPGTAVPVEIVIQHLDEHPGDSQHHKRNDVGNDQNRDAGQMQPKQSRPQGGKYQRDTKRQRERNKQMHHVHEGRQAQDVRISPEYPEEDKGQWKHDTQSTDHLPIHQPDIREKEPHQECDKNRKDNHYDVKKEYRPGWQHPG